MKRTRPSYDEIYLESTQEIMSGILDSAVNILGMKLEKAYKSFLDSHYAKDVENAVQYVVWGMSGTEMLFDVLELSNEEIRRLKKKIDESEPVKDFPFGCSAEYRTGWALAWYQWHSGFTFREINEKMPIEKVRDICKNVRGEKDLPRFKEAMDAATGM